MELEPDTAYVYVRHAFAQMLEVAARLGDEKANVRPFGPSTNAVAALVVHCCEVTKAWWGHIGLGEPSVRDRETEFSRTATVAELYDMVEETLAAADGYLQRLGAGETTDNSNRELLPGGDVSDASLVLHVVEEVFQHLGHIELTADALTAESG
jgi:uncharacterized damage-inducible protein DinB